VVVISLRSVTTELCSAEEDKQRERKKDRERERERKRERGWTSSFPSEGGKYSVGKRSIIVLGFTRAEGKAWG
jgi:hypothetical protein